MRVQDFVDILAEWAPPWTAWERDNVGLQVGDANKRVSRVLVTLDVTPAVVRQAVRSKTDLIISHHPLLFRSPRSITADDRLGGILLQLIEHQVAVLSAHTNLDFARGGVSFALAQQLELKNIQFLSPLQEQMLKIAVFVPPAHVDKVSEAMAQAGGGIIGEYSHCSFRLRGTGTFRGSEAANPYLGKAGQLETVDEVRLEMIAPRAQSAAILRAMRSAHPYEEVAYDVYPLLNDDPNHGMGAIGDLTREMTLKAFLSFTKKQLRAASLRYCGTLDTTVRRVAVCGGSGSELLTDAVRQKADAFVTADVRYHAFHDANEQIALIDAGHWETEHVVLKPMAKRLLKAIRQGKANVDVRIQNATNPIQSF